MAMMRRIGVYPGLLSTRNQEIREYLRRRETLVVKRKSTWSLQLFVSIIISVSGFICQVFMISLIYFGYDVVAEIYVKKPTNFRPPALTLCVPFDDIIDLAQMPSSYQTKYQNWTESQKRGTRKSVKEMESWFTFQQIFDFTPKVKEMVTCYSYRRMNSYRSEYFKVNNTLGPLVVKLSFKLIDKCFTFIHKHHSSPSFTYNFRKVMYGFPPGMLLNISLKFTLKYVLRLGIYLHPINRLPRGDIDFPLILDTKSANNGTHITLTYSVMRKHLLPTPYKTQCKNYTRLGYESREHFLDQCLADVSLKRFNKIPFTVLVEEDNTLYGGEKMYGKYSVEDSDELSEQLDLLEEECRRKSPQPICSHEYLLPKLVSKNDDRDHSTHLILLAPNQPDVEVKFYPKMHFTEYVTYILSCLGFWFGFNSLTAIRDCKALKKYLPQ